MAGGRVGGLAAIGLLAACGTVAQGQTAAGGAPPSARPAPCRVEARLASDQQVTIGQPFTLELQGVGPAGATWSFPAQAESADVELRAAPAEEGPKPAPGRQRYLAQAFALGEVSVPAIVAECRLADGSRHEVKSEPVTLRMRSLLPKDPAEQKLSDIRPPLALSPGAAFWVALGALLAALAAGVTLAVRRRWRRTAPARQAAEVVVPPDVEARLALSRLARDGPLRRDDLRGHYIALTHVAKRYLERRLGGPVLEMTSLETLAYLRRHTHGELLLGGMRALVGSADRVKFARGLAAREEGERDLGAVGAMVDGLEAALGPVPGPGSGREVNG